MTLHLLHLPQAEGLGTDGDYASLRLATRAAHTLPGRHLLVAVNSAGRLDLLHRSEADDTFASGTIAPPNSNMHAARNVHRLIEAWSPHAIVLWHPALVKLGLNKQFGDRGANGIVDRPSLIEAWRSPNASSIDQARPPSHTRHQVISAMARLMGRESLGIDAEDDRPVVSILANVPSQVDAWWFSVILNIVESAGIRVIGAAPVLARQRGRARRYRHVSGLSSPVIEYDLPYDLVLEASDIIISIPRDTDSELELGEVEVSDQRAGDLHRVSICRALSRGIPSIVARSDAELIPTGLRTMLAAEGTRASQVAARTHTLLADSELLDQVRRVLASSEPVNIEDGIIGWVQERISLRDIRARVHTMAGTRG